MGIGLFGTIWNFWWSFLGFSSYGIGLHKCDGHPVITDDYSLMQVFEISIITMLLVMFSGIRPAWQAANLDPLKVLRAKRSRVIIESYAAPPRTSHHNWTHN